jgi:hypothetical protein
MKGSRILLGFLLALGFSSCSKDDSPPVVTILDPADGARITAGTVLVVQADFADNEKLKQYKINIHGDHDGHSHKASNSFADFDTIIVDDIFGSSASRTIHITTPADARPGPYHLQVFALDDSGNEGLQVVTFWLTNPQDTVKPQVQINQPTGGSSLGNSFSFDATITDLQSDMATPGVVENIHVLLRNKTNAAMEFELGTYGVAQFPGFYDVPTGAFAATYNRPANLEPGVYYLILEGRDEYFNTGEINIEVIFP